jgi:hypothetical protein
MSKSDFYPPLSTSKLSQEIRTLDLEPVPDEEILDPYAVLSSLRGTLRVLSLEDSPKYTALSYVWGIFSPEAWIIENARPTAVSHLGR